MTKIGLTAFLILVGCRTTTWVSYLQGNELSPFDKSIPQVFEDNSGQLWAISYSGNVYLFDKESDAWEIKLTFAESNPGTAQIMAKGINGAIWIGFTNGLGVYHPKNDEAFNYVVVNGVENKDVREILQDQDGVLWLGLDHGILKSEDGGQTWDKIIIEEGFSDFVVRAIYQDSRGDIWVAGDALYRYEPISGDWTTFTAGGKRLNSLTHEWVSPPPETDVLPNDFLSSIAESVDGTLWFGTFNEGAIYFNPNLNQWGSLTSATGLLSNSVESVAVDNNGNVWFGTNSGVSRYHVANDEWFHYNNNNGYTNYMTKNILIDNNGNIWFGTFGDGIYRYNQN